MKSTLAEQRGISDEKIATIVAGQRPSDLAPEEVVAYDLASALVSHGALPELNYRQAVQRFGVHGSAELIYLGGIASYRLLHPQWLLRAGTRIHCDVDGLGGYKCPVAFKVFAARA